MALESLNYKYVIKKGYYEELFRLQLSVCKRAGWEGRAVWPTVICHTMIYFNTVAREGT